MFHIEKMLVIDRKIAEIVEIVLIMVMQKKKHKIIPTIQIKCFVAQAVAQAVARVAQPTRRIVNEQTSKGVKEVPLG